MAYEVVMPYHLHMPSYFLETFTEYPKCNPKTKGVCQNVDNAVVSFVGARFARPKTVGLCLQAGKPCPYS